MEILLVVLLIRSGQIVTINQLASDVWGDAAPRRATAALRVHISQLRKFLRSSDGAEDPIETRPSGYLLNVEHGQLDLHLFQDGVEAGRQFSRNGQHAEAVAAFEGALALWRGPVLSGMRDSPIVSAFGTWLDEFRLECSELLVEASLALGKHRDMVKLLQALVAEYPLREAFHRQLMLALYRSERRADALQAYRNVHETLNRELGLDPGRALRSLHRAILQADNWLDSRTAC
jgi:DNA-binding SARP family transcriptional activator